MLAFVASWRKAPTTRSIDERQQPPDRTSGLANGPENAPSSSLKRTIIVGCDLLIPGSFLGWIPASSLQVGVATLVSTLLSMGDVWARVQAQGQ